MRKISKILAGLALGVGTMSANAAITITETQTPGTGADAGFSIVRLYAKFGANSPEAQAGATGLQSVLVDATTDNNPLKIIFTALNAPFNQPNDADIYGQESSADASSGTPVDAYTNNADVGTFIRVGDSSSSPWAPQYLEAAPGPGVNLIGKNTTSATNTAANVQTNFGSTKHLRVDGILQAASDPNALTDDPTKNGALFAVLVVPTGTTGNVHVEVAADKGSITKADLQIGVPEPGTLGLLAIGSLGLLRRRRTA